MKVSQWMAGICLLGTLGVAQAEARPDPDLARVCAEEAARWGLARQPDVSDGHIVARCVQPLVDEGQRLLAEGVTQRASDIDYYYASRLPGEAQDGVNDRHFHPVEPRSARLTLSYAF